MDLTTVNRREIAGYLGARQGVMDAALAALVEDCLLELNETVSPRHVSLTAALSVENAEAEKPLLSFAGLRVNTRDLARNLSGCDEVLLFAATIGEGADCVIRKYENTKLSRAAVCQAAAAAMIEAYCNTLNAEWKREYEAQGRFLRPRFSCGYGDFALAHQRDFLRVLEMEKRIGVHLNDALLMLPTKSVTAVIGIGNRISDQ